MVPKDSNKLAASAIAASQSQLASAVLYATAPRFVQSESWWIPPATVRLPETYGASESRGEEAPGAIKKAVASRLPKQKVLSSPAARSILHSAALLTAILGRLEAGMCAKSQPPFARPQEGRLALCRGRRSPARSS